MGVITESDGAAGEYEEVEIPAAPDTDGGLAGSVLRRKSPRPSRRAVLYVHSSRGSGVPSDLARWFTERGFHFYLADVGPQRIPGGRARLARVRRRAARRARFARLDAACGYLRETDGIDSVVISAHSADALTVALWCDARRDAEPPGALILSSPAFGRRLRRGLRIACPVLVMSPAAGQAGSGQAGSGQAGSGQAGSGQAGSGQAGSGQAAPPKISRFRRKLDSRAMAPAGARFRRRGSNGITTALGPHVTWLWLASGLEGAEHASAADRRLLFDEMGRWLGAYMYGKVRDQLI
ncbi:MAG: hypothetical protein ABSB01_03090 [Streptosporangiaceae bacterium]|jgi:hypothetical protein